ncbi:MAG: NAD-dependent epimerase/dehydratase family protein [Thermodesulfobacteriota bacterium]
MADDKHGDDRYSTAMKSYRGSDVLVTGGLGFIGSNLAHRLVSLGAQVTLIDSLIPAYGGNLFNIEDIKDKVLINIADVRDENSMNYLVRNRDYIFNLAGQVSHIDSMQDPYTDLEINCRSQLSILEACKKNNPAVKIVYAGTRQVYGKPDYLPVDEKHLLQPVDVNGINNMAGEWYHILYNDVYGIRATSLRLTNTYGPRQLMKHNRQGFVYWFIRQALDGEEIQLFGDGSQERDFTYVEDVVDALLLVGAHDEANGEIFNLGGERAYSLLEFVELLLKVCGSGSYRTTPFPEERKVIDIGSFYADYAKIKDAIGWGPTIALEEGLRRTVEFYRKNKEHYWD